MKERRLGVFGELQGRTMEFGGEEGRAAAPSAGFFLARWWCVKNERGRDYYRRLRG